MMEMEPFLFCSCRLYLAVLGLLMLGIDAQHPRPAGYHGPAHHHAPPPPPPPLHRRAGVDRSACALIIPGLGKSAAVDHFNNVK